MAFFGMHADNPHRGTLGCSVHAPYGLAMHSSESHMNRSDGLHEVSTCSDVLSWRRDHIRAHFERRRVAICFLTCLPSMLDHPLQPIDVSAHSEGNALCAAGGDGD